MVEKLLKTGKLVICLKKLKKILKTQKEGKSVDGKERFSIRCVELFFPSETEKGHCARNDASPFIAAHIAAQKHFVFRPNIYI